VKRDGFWVLFQGDNATGGNFGFNFINGTRGGGGVFPGDPALGADGGFMNAGGGRSLGGAAKINFAAGNGVGQAKEAADVISVKNVIHDKIERLSFDLSKFLRTGRFNS